MRQLNSRLRVTSLRRTSAPGASPSRGAAAAATTILRTNGKPSLGISVSKTRDANTVAVVHRVEDALEELESEIAGVQFDIVFEQASFVEESISGVIREGALGALFAVIVVLIFLSFSVRSTLVIAVSIPLSVFAAFALLNWQGLTLNMMTLVGLIVVIGLLMDDAIVISENIAAQLSKGKKSLEAAIEGTRQVMPGVLSSFFTTAMIVGPLAFLSGKMGDVLKYIPAVLLITLLISLIEAFLILPAHLHHSMKHFNKKDRSRFRQKFEQGFEWVRDALFLPLVAKATRNPQLAIGLMVLLLLISFATIPAGILKYQAFPSLDSDVIQARIILPQGTPLSRTE